MRSWQAVRPKGPWIPDAQPGMLACLTAQVNTRNMALGKQDFMVMGTSRVMSLSALYREAAAVTRSVGRLEWLLALLIGS